MFTNSPRAQGYKVVQYIAFRYRDLKEGRDGAHLIASAKPFQTLGPEYEMHPTYCGFEWSVLSRFCLLQLRYVRYLSCKRTHSDSLSQF